MFATPLTLAGFALRHGAWVKLASQRLTPTLIAPGQTAIPEFSPIEGSELAALREARSRRDALAPSVTWTAVVFEGRLAGRDVLVVEWHWSWALRSGRVFGRLGRSEDGSVTLDEVLQVAPDRDTEGSASVLLALGDGPRAEADAGIQAHREVIEAVVERV